MYQLIIISGYIFHHLHICQFELFELGWMSYCLWVGFPSAGLGWNQIERVSLLHVHPPPPSVWYRISREEVEIFQWFYTLCLCQAFQNPYYSKQIQSVSEKEGTTKLQIKGDGYGKINDWTY